MAKHSQILLLEDVYPLGKSGDLVQVKPGYARNFLYPQGKAVVASKHTLRMQERLQAERAKKAAMDLEESTAVAAQLKGVQLSKEVKVDPDGHMYGSVSVADLLDLLSQSGFSLEKHNIALAHPIKKTGLHTIDVRLKEGVEATFSLRISPEGGVEVKEEEKAVEAAPSEASSEEA